MIRCIALSIFLLATKGVFTAPSYTSSVYTYSAVPESEKLGTILYGASEKIETKPPPSLERLETKPPASSVRLETKPPPSSERLETKPPQSYERLETKPPPSSERLETKPPPSSERLETEPPPSSVRLETKPSASSERLETKPPPSSVRLETKPTPSSERLETKPPPSSERIETKPPPSSESLEDERALYLEKSVAKLPPASGKVDTKSYLHSKLLLLNQNSSLPSTTPRVADISCGTHVLADGSFSIESPNYPGNYPTFRTCQYTVSSQSGSTISFSCSAFNLEYHSSCRWDWLQVNGIKFCGTTAPQTIYSSTFQVEFRSDYSVTRSGYRCTFTVGAVDPNPATPGSVLSCGSATLPRGSYSIKSINHPSAYVNNHLCSYQLNAETSGDTLSISCSSFSIESHSQCGWDWLDVNSQKYCGESAPSVTSLNSMSITFRTDYSVVRTGFLCTIQVTAPATPTGGSTLQCGASSLARGTYTVKSINHPANYINNHDCNYRLTAVTAGDSLGVSCSAFNVESHSRCAWDSLSVNGQKYCGTLAPNVISDNMMSLVFHTDYSVVRTGFLCTIVVAAVVNPSPGDTLACRAHTLARGSYTIKSINHPSNYVNNHDCNYQLNTAVSGDRISVSCSAFNLEYSSICRWDWFSVDGTKYCGTSGPTQAATNAMALAFHTDYSVVRTGFQCTVEVADNTVVPPPPPSSSCQCGRVNRASRIVGGQETEVREYPWQAGLVATGGTRTFCGGTVINNRYVLTAAHCTVNRSPSNTQVLLKEHLISVSDGELRVSLTSILNHPSYTSASRSGFDFSLLRLDQTLSFPSDNSLAPACLPSSNSATYEGVDAIVTGWGATSSGAAQSTTLLEVTVPVISNSNCASSYGTITSTMLCAGLAAGGKDSCQGDSGGPLVTLENSKYALIGVVSFGNGCALPNYPGVYGRITSVQSWIQTNTADATYCT